MPSRLLRYLRWGQAVMAWLALCYADLPSTLQIVAGLCLLWWASRRTEPPQVLFFSQAQLAMNTSQGLATFRLQRECHCHPQLLVLRYRLDGEAGSVLFSSCHTLVLLADSSAPDSLRQLRMLLRWHAFSEEMLL